MKRNQRGFSIIEVLLILLVAGMVAFTGWFVYHSSKNTDKTYDAAAQAASNIPKQSAKSQSQTPEVPDTAKTFIPTAAEKQQIQGAAKTYLTSNGASNGSYSFSLPQEQTLISQNRQFAIQWYCGPPPSDCSAIALRLLNGQWQAIGSGIDVKSQISDLNKNYNWPLDFF